MKRAVPYVLFAVFLGVMLLGLFWGEFRTVTEKAITVCLDCIGIG